MSGEPDSDLAVPGPVRVVFADKEFVPAAAGAVRDETARAEQADIQSFRGEVLLSESNHGSEAADKGVPR